MRRGVLLADLRKAKAGLGALNQRGMGLDQTAKAFEARAGTLAKSELRVIESLGEPECAKPCGTFKAG